MMILLHNITFLSHTPGLIIILVFTMLVSSILNILAMFCKDTSTQTRELQADRESWEWGWSIFTNVIAPVI